MIRLTGGEYRGRILRTLSSRDTRPTQSKLRQALFNSLQTVIGDARVLDLFAGSGALGLEALSRGAAEAVFVESAKAAAHLILENAGLLGAGHRVRVLTARVEDAWDLMARHGPFDLVLADPPYAEYLARGGVAAVSLLQNPHWETLLCEGGLFCLETAWSREQPRGLPEQTGFLVKAREKKYGDSLLTTYRRQASAPEVNHESA